MGFSYSNITFIFSKESFPYVSGNRFFYILGNGNPPKNLYVSGKVYSQPWYNATFLYFGTVIFRILACLELETYSEK